MNLSTRRGALHRRAHFVQGKTIKAISRELGIARNTIRKVLRSGETCFAYEREVQPRPKLGQWTEDLEKRLAANDLLSRRERLGLIRISRTCVSLGMRVGTIPSVVMRPRVSASRAPYPAMPSCRCLVQFDKNRYSVMAQVVGRPVEVHAYADRVVMRQDGGIIASHDRCFGREQTIYNPWHYVPVLTRKPGAMRNGAPFKDWVGTAGCARSCQAEAQGCPRRQSAKCGQTTAGQRARRLRF